MRLVNKNYDLLDKLSDKFLKQHDVPSEFFLKKMWSYYYHNDLETNNCLADIFYRLYLTEKKDSYDKIVLDFNIGLSTLSRYRKKFNDLAEKLLPTID